MQPHLQALVELEADHVVLAEVGDVGRDLRLLALSADGQEVAALVGAGGLMVNSIEFQQTVQRDFQQSV